MEPNLLNFIAEQICELEPGLYRDCDASLRSLQGRLEILAVSVHAEGDTGVDQYNDHEDVPSLKPKAPADGVQQVSEKIEKPSTGNENTEGAVKQNKCSTCNAYVGDAKQYRDHFKSQWHKHNLKRKTRQLPSLTAEDCLADMETDDSKSDLKDYSEWIIHEPINLIQALSV